MILSTPTPASRMNRTQACPISFCGKRVTKSTGTPKFASETATLASPPPYTTSKLRACANRCIPGGESRIMISPKVTTRAILHLDSQSVHPKAMVRLARLAWIVNPARHPRNALLHVVQTKQPARSALIDFGQHIIGQEQAIDLPATLRRYLRLGRIVKVLVIRLEESIGRSIHL